MPTKSGVTGVKLVARYSHGDLWVEKDILGRWRLRFGHVFENNQADFIYSKWQVPLSNMNALDSVVIAVVRHYEKLYGIRS